MPPIYCYSIEAQEMSPLPLIYHLQSVYYSIQAQAMSPLPSQIGELLCMAAESEDAECSLFVMKMASSKGMQLDHGILLLLMNLAARTGRTQLTEVVISS